jgi:putative glutamine amidotransferase
MTPLIGIPCCTRRVEHRLTHWASEQYLGAVSDAAGAAPVLLPALGERTELAALVTRLDGLMLTGSRSNIEPAHYGDDDAAEPSEDDPRDPQRDALTLPLIRAAVAAGLPVLAICRGIQELNVALGGTLHRRIHELPGRLDHRARMQLPVEGRYAYDAHTVMLTPGGFLRGLAGAGEIAVNSLHWQGIDRLAPGLAVEAAAPDGQIEAVRHPDAPFVVGVQWHPEFRTLENPMSRALFAAWGNACRDYAGRRLARRTKALDTSVAT